MQKIIIYLIVFTISLAIGGWICEYTRLYTKKPEKLLIVKNQIRDINIPIKTRLGIFCGLTPLPKYSGYYSGLPENTNFEYPNIGFPKCPASGYRQCTNNVYSAAVDPKDNEDFFDRTQIPIGSNNKCQYGSTYSSCYQKPNKTEIQQLQESYCKIKDQENRGSLCDFKRINMYDRIPKIDRSDN